MAKTMAHNKITDNMCLRWRRRAGRQAGKQASMQLEARKGQQRECRPIREETRPADYHNVCVWMGRFRVEPVAKDVSIECLKLVIIGWVEGVSRIV